jgi:hypothetical protein
MVYGATAHNRSVYASPLKRLGVPFREVGDASHAPLHPHLCKPWKPTVSFIGLAKTSYTAGTLGDIYLKKVFKKIVLIL